VKLWYLKFHVNAFLKKMIKL